MRRAGAVTAVTVGLAVLGGAFSGRIPPAGATGACFVSPDKGFSVGIGGEFTFDPDPTHGNARWSGTIDWGDGSPPERFGNGDHDIAHRWTKAGTFTMTVTASGTIEGPDGSQTPCSNARTVVAKAQVTGPLTAVFRATPSGNGRTFSFDASGSTPPDQITTYSWVFGDGTSGSGVRVNHTFHEDRPYSVTLTVNGSVGRRAQSQQRVLVPASTATSGKRAASSTGNPSSAAAASRSGDGAGIPAGALAAGAAGVVLVAAGAYFEIQRRRAAAADVLSGATGSLTADVESKLAAVEQLARHIAESQEQRPRSESFGVIDPNHPAPDTGTYQQAYYEVLYDEHGVPHFVPLNVQGANTVSTASPE